MKNIWSRTSSHNAITLRCVFPVSFAGVERRFDCYEDYAPLLLQFRANSVGNDVMAADRILS